MMLSRKPHLRTILEFPCVGGRALRRKRQHAAGARCHLGHIAEHGPPPHVADERQTLLLLRGCRRWRCGAVWARITGGLAFCGAANAAGPSGWTLARAVACCTTVRPPESSLKRWLNCGPCGQRLDMCRTLVDPGSTRRAGYKLHTANEDHKTDCVHLQLQSTYEAEQTALSALNHYSPPRK